MVIKVNGCEVNAPADVRVSLLELLRDQLGLTGTKVGCNQGACGACTVLVDGERVLSCLMLAVQAEDRAVTTIEGLGEGGAEGEAGVVSTISLLQRAFIDHDGLQCGYCTPGQICAASAMLREVDAGMPSYISPDLSIHPVLTRDEVRERMSGNLCRCGAYTNIADAVMHVLKREGASS